jgi:RNA polymerase sigma-70 factor (ECF subfamily)
MTSSVETSLTELRMMVQGDNPAWLTFAKRYEPLIHQWCRLKSLASNDIEELTQRVLIKLARSLGSYDPDQGTSFRSWLFRVVTNTIYDFFREKSRFSDQGISLDHLPPQAEGTCILDQLIHNVESSLEELGHVGNRVRSEVSARDWNLFWMIQVERCPLSEAAQAFDMTPAAAGMIRLRVQRKLKEAFQRAGFGV